MSNEEQLKSISEIRDLMNKSSRFISLSGLSGVMAGFWALVGGVIAHYILQAAYVEQTQLYYITEKDLWLLVLDAVGVVVLAISTGIIFTVRRATKQNGKFLDETSLRMIGNLMIPLVVGGGFCLVLIYYTLYGLVAPAMLIFYGLALINASKYTLNAIRFLGFIEILLGFISCVYIGKGLLFWMIGFGVMHILYGIFMYFMYERKEG